MVEAIISIYQDENGNMLVGDHCYHIKATRADDYAEFRNEFSAAVFLNFVTYDQYIDFERERWVTQDHKIIYVIR